MKILAVFAHPDDESFGPAGTLAQMARNGVPTGLFTLTRGEAGSLGIDRFSSRQQLAAARVEELKCAAHILGVDLLQIGNFPDKQLQGASAEGKAAIAQIIDSFSPDTIITFHPGGISGHPDHIAVSHWCADLIRETYPAIRLLYYGVIRQQAAWVPHRPLIPMAESEVTHRIDVTGVLDRKIAAIQCHRTQQKLWQEFQSLPVDYRTFARFEFFAQAHPAPAQRSVSDHL